MDVRLLTQDPQGVDGLAADLLILVLPAQEAAWQLPAGLRERVKALVSQGDLSLKPGKSVLLHHPAGLKARRLVVAVAASGEAKALQAALGSAIHAARGTGARAWALGWAGAAAACPADRWAAVGAQTLGEAFYSYTHTKPSAEASAAPRRVQLLVEPTGLVAAKEGLRRGQAIAAGANLARECANRPANHCTPSHLADVAKRLATDHGVKVDVLDRKAVEKLRMGAFLAVAQGAAEPLKFIVLRYNGAAAKDAPVVLVGKGITFDTGGISIKPAAGMDEMKFDMGGAASVLGTFRAVAELKPRINLVGLIPACENMPSGTATRPGDVVTSMSGQTIEILNTDAEGRLVLCDALTYAERFKPAVVVDIATLTGACVVALGHHHSGLFTADEDVAAALTVAGAQSLDTVWRMPLDEEYDAGLRSNFADIANVGPREGGAITAAMFLKRFTKAYPWAHLDIAGTAWKSGGAKGSTGRPVPLLTTFVLDRAQVHGASAASGSTPARGVKVARSPQAVVAAPAVAAKKATVARRARSSAA